MRSGLDGKRGCRGRCKAAAAVTGEVTLTYRDAGGGGERIGVDGPRR